MALGQTDTWQISQHEPELKPPQLTWAPIVTQIWWLNECYDVLLQASLFLHV